MHVVTAHTPHPLTHKTLTTHPHPTHKPTYKPTHLRPLQHLLHRALLPLALLPRQLAQLLPHRSALITVLAAHWRSADRQAEQGPWARAQGGAFAGGVRPA